MIGVFGPKSPTAPTCCNSKLDFKVTHGVTMEPLKISLCVYLKNARRPNATYYARMRKDGKTTDIPLNTKERGVADAWVRLRRSEIQRYNDYCLVGEEPPSDLLSKLPLSGVRKAQKATISLRECSYSWEAEMRRRGLRERTIGAYMKNIRLTVPLDEPLSSFTKDNVRLWMAKHDSLRSATRKHYSVSLREFAKYLVDFHDLDPRIVSGWPMIKVDQVEKGYWRMNEIYHIIEAVECRDKVCEQQMKAYLWLMATAGSRQGETALLKWTDFREGCITFRAENTKTNKTRVVPLDMRICDMLMKLPREDDYIFGAIPKSQAGRFAILARAVRKSGMPTGNLHKMRHSACMYMYSHCKDIKTVAQMVGHSPAVSLQHYIKAREADELRTVVDKVYHDEILIPNAMDDLIKAGLI